MLRSLVARLNVTGSVKKPYLSTTSLNAPMESNPAGIVFRGNYAYVGFYSVGVVGPNMTTPELEIWDISSPLSPVIVGSTTTPGLHAGIGIYGLALQNNYLYMVALKEQSLLVIDVSNPTAPTTASVLYLDNFPVDVKVRGNYCYVSTVQLNKSTNNVFVVDITDLTNPSIVSTTDIAFGYTMIALDYPYAYVANTDPGVAQLSVINVSNAAAPSIVGSVSLTSTLRGSVVCTLYQRYLYILITTPASLVVVDPTDPTNPTIINTVSLPMTLPLSMTIQNDIAFIVPFQNPAKVYSYDISDPNSISLTSSIDTPQDCVVAAIYQNYLYVMSNSYTGDTPDWSRLVAYSMSATP